jgi:hypothetical protein
MDDYIQINRINTQAIPGPNFAPGVTIYGGGLVAPVGGWVVPTEEVEPVGERPDAGFHPKEVNSSPAFANGTMGVHPVPLNSRYPYRRMQFDKGVTIVEADKFRNPMRMDYAAIILLVLAIALIASRAS